jgi:hypothetical protein
MIEETERMKMIDAPDVKVSKPATVGGLRAVRVRRSATIPTAPYANIQPAVEIEIECLPGESAESAARRADSFCKKMFDEVTRDMLAERG